VRVHGDHPGVPREELSGCPRRHARGGGGADDRGVLGPARGRRGRVVLCRGRHLCTRGPPGPAAGGGQAGRRAARLRRPVRGTAGGAAVGGYLLPGAVTVPGPAAAGDGAGRDAGPVGSRGARPHGRRGAWGRPHGHQLGARRGMAGGLNAQAAPSTTPGTTWKATPRASSARDAGASAVAGTSRTTPLPAAVRAATSAVA